MVFIFDANALGLLTQIEGSAWRRLQDGQQANPIEHPYGFHFWHLAWQEKAKYCAQDSSAKNFPLAEFLVAQSYGDASSNGVIYGEGGWSRYQVTPQGELILIGSSIREEKRLLAEELGFTIR